jgi:putative transposase
MTIAFGISGVQVTRILDSIALFRGYPATRRTDQGPEFTCRALDQWALSMVLSRLISRASQSGETRLLRALTDDFAMNV